MEDICLILEGTYPFVRGGVSSWVDLLIKGMPDLKFSLITIMPTIKDKNVYKYDLPANVTSFIEVFLQDTVIHQVPAPQKSKAKILWKTIRDYFNSPPNERTKYFSEMIEGLAIDKTRAINTKDFLFSKEMWDIVVEQYNKTSPNESFIDYFWTWRFINMPILQMLNVEIPQAKLYHTVCTGYAGLVGIKAKQLYNAPLLLTEHGIYTKERNIEINRSDWIYTKKEAKTVIKRTPGTFKEMWINSFTAMGKLCYDYSDEITTLYGGNKKLEIEFGAEESKIKIIPNGVILKDFLPLINTFPKTDGRLRVGLVGRVVPIKDIKTFIKACKMVADEMENVDFLVIGPTEEDEEYFKECLSLTEMLGLNGRLTFTGKADVKKYYPMLDVKVLTSISEGQPLTILEALCVGVPIVSSDVGSCSELIYGYTDEDKKLGSCGIITAIGKPRETGEAIIKILKDDNLRKQMIQSGLKRVKKYYDQDAVIAQYRDLYERHMLKAGKR
ncbi:MAG: hypothetical protein A2252_00830 [Elusimicrobia bacterium RIFOXYA2_FULL_39_19]|nr:MAG: hypothetical protein A2252_00830 [Elusimicrobia bacterium RIFOXYA2_FULL_39_19]